jgi:hypothetical protein
MDGVDDRQPWQQLPEVTVAKLDEDGHLAYAMGEVAEEVACYMRKGGFEFDYSPESIKALENVLSGMYRKFPRGLWAKLTRRTITEAQIWDKGVSWGAYLGEVIRRNLGGRWVCRIATDPALGMSHPYAVAPEKSAQFIVLPSGGVIAPLSKVFKRLADGPADDVVSYYWMVRHLEEEKRANLTAATRE